MSESPDSHLGPPTLNEQQIAGHNLSMLYCGLFVVATAGIILAIYHCLALNWCADYPPAWQRNSEAAGTERKFNARKLVELDSNLFKYKGSHQEAGSGTGSSEEECVVCLSVFEEGEDVRELVRCKHSFHAPCIDMWLYSHFDCPLCRAPVGGRDSGAAQSENSDSGLTEPDFLPIILPV